jgi:hypothetical protein
MNTKKIVVRVYNLDEENIEIRKKGIGDFETHKLAAIFTGFQPRSIDSSLHSRSKRYSDKLKIRVCFRNIVL